MLVKCRPQNRESTSNLVREIRLFEKEMEMYVKTLPKISNVLGEKEIKRGENGFGCKQNLTTISFMIGEKTWSLAARCVYSAEEPNTVIIFEDLSPLGYQMYCRQEGYDLDHCLLVVKKLARLHAASVLLHEKVTAIF